MKALFTFIACLVTLNSAIAQQPPPVIRNFLTALQRTDWKFQDIDNKYLFSPKPDKPVAYKKGDREQIRAIYLQSLKTLSRELKGVKINDISVVRYDLADTSLQTMILDKSTQKNTYIITNKAGFKHYLLLKGDKITAWIMFKEGRSFLGYVRV